MNHCLPYLSHFGKNDWLKEKFEGLSNQKQFSVASIMWKLAVMGDWGFNDFFFVKTNKDTLFNWYLKKNFKY